MKWDYAVLAGWLAFAPASYAQEDTAAVGEGGATAETTGGITDKAVTAAGDAWDAARTILREGDNILYLSGYAYHGRGTYSPEKIAEFNEQAWGAGFGRTLLDARGNSNTLFALAFLDSHSDVEAQVGYAREWRWQFAPQASVGAGFVAMLVSRSDIFDHIPFPAVLPLASLEVGRVAVMASYVPNLGGDGGNGDVLYLFGRINLGR